MNLCREPERDKKWDPRTKIENFQLWISLWSKWGDLFPCSILNNISLFRRLHSTLWTQCSLLKTQFVDLSILKYGRKYRTPQKPNNLDRQSVVSPEMKTITTDDIEITPFCTHPSLICIEYYANLSCRPWQSHLQLCSCTRLEWGRRWWTSCPKRLVRLHKRMINGDRIVYYWF